MVPTYRWRTPSITCRLGQSAAQRNHIIPHSNDYHETVPGAVWLRDVALQADWLCGGTRGNEQRRTPTQIQVEIGNTPSAATPGRIRDVPEFDLICYPDMRLSIEIDRCQAPKPGGLGVETLVRAACLQDDAAAGDSPVSIAASMAFPMRSAAACRSRSPTWAYRRVILGSACPSMRATVGRETPRATA